MSAVEQATTQAAGAAAAREVGCKRGAGGGVAGPREAGLDESLFLGRGLRCVQREAGKG